MDRTRPIGIGLIGCGSFGRFCLDAYGRMDDVRVVAVCDSDRPRCDAVAETHEAQPIYDARKLIAREGIDLVHIATPPASHGELVSAAIQAGRDVLCEKPLALRIDEACRLVAEAHEADRIAVVNFVMRYNPITEAVKAVLDSAVLGTPLAGRMINCAFDTYLPADHWFWDKNVSGGIFIEHGVHFFDLYAYWLGPGDVIDAHTEKREGSGLEDRAACTVRHHLGALVHHYHGFDQIEPMDRADHRIVCELGDVRLSGWIPLELTVDAAVDDAGGETLASCCPGCEMETVQRYGKNLRHIAGRGKMRSVTRRIRLTYKPDGGKAEAYARSIRALLGDQIAYVRDRDHHRQITEDNGRDALALASDATALATEEGL